MIQIAELGGVYAVSFLIVAVNAALPAGLGPRPAAGPCAAAAPASARARPLGFGWRALGGAARRRRPLGSR